MRKLAYLGAISLLLLGHMPAYADWIATQGEYSFGPDVSEEIACQRAERRAKDNALKAAQGERLTSDDMLVCKEKESQANCDMNRFTWSTINGVISGVRDISRHTSTLSGAFRTCTVSLSANVEIAQGQADPNFDLAVRLNEKVFKDGDIMQLLLEPSTPMYVSVFQWLPYEKNERQVLRIFPNVMDRDHRFVGPTTVPTAQGQENYDMQVAFPQGLKTQDRLVDEYLLIVATKKDIAFREDYRLEEFNKRLLEIPRDESRVVKRAYMVVRGGD